MTNHLQATTNTPGLHQLADGVHAWLQPPGTWGFGNAGLVVGCDGRALLVDTLNDLATTQAMLDAMTAATAGAVPPVGTLVNTCGESDHCWGNQLVVGPHTETISTAAGWEELKASQPSALVQLTKLVKFLPADMKRLAKAITEPFSFEGIRLTPPTRMIEGDARVDCGGRGILVLDLGAAHAHSDLAVWVEDSAILFAGDLVISGQVPLLAGSSTTWLAALDRLAALHPAVVVPGHGAVGDSSLIDATRRFLEWLGDSVAAEHHSGASAPDAIARIRTAMSATEFAPLLNPERLVVSVHTLWADHQPGYKLPAPPVLYSQMGRMMA